MKLSELPEFFLQFSFTFIPQFTNSENPDPYEILKWIRIRKKQKQKRRVSTKKPMRTRNTTNVPEIGQIGLQLDARGLNKRRQQIRNFSEPPTHRKYF